MGGLDTWRVAMHVEFLELQGVYYALIYLHCEPDFYSFYYAWIGRFSLELEDLFSIVFK